MSLSLLFLLSTGITRAQSVPTPKEHFGFNIGDNYQLATYSQTEAYFKKLAATSNRTKLVDMGRTEEGRTQWMLVVSSPDNIAKLDHYRKISQLLAHAEDITDEQARALAAEGKAVIWIDGGLHATETVGAHQLIETAYTLTSRKDAETMRILDNTIILLVHANPDGQELVSNWYMREAKPEKRSLNSLPRLYEKYAGHDNNRDFFMANLKETQNMNRQLYIEWLPQIMYNHHQAGPAGSVVAGAPYRDPFNYVFDPLLMTSLDAVGAAMINRLNVEGKPGYTQRTGSTFSTWYNGGLRTTTYFHNIIGLLTEIIGSPTPSEVPLVPQRLIPDGATPNPVTPQKWYFRQSIDYSISLNYAVLNYATRYRDELLYNIYKMGRNSIERGSKDYWGLSPKRIDAINTAYQNDQKKNAAARGSQALSTEAPGGAFRQGGVPVKYFDSIMKDRATRDPRGFILPADQSDFPTATKFINALVRTGVLVHKATADFTINGKKYPAGSYVVKTNQAFRPHVLDMFEPQDHPNDFRYPGGPPVAPYDAAGWTLAYLMGVEFDRLTEDFDGPFQRVPYGELQQPAAQPAKASAGYVLNSAANNSFLVVNDLLKAGAPVFRTKEGGNGYAAGSFFVPAGGKAKGIIEKGAAEYGITSATIAKRPAGLKPVKQLRIALWDTYGGSMPSGWLRFLFEQFHFDADVIYPPTIDSGGLSAKYDVIVFVGGAIPAAGGEGGGRFGGGGFGGPQNDSIPDEFRGRRGRITADKSVPELKKFLEAGGQVVTIGSSTSLAYHLKLPVRNALVEMVNGEEQRLPNEKYYIPGSVLRASIDSTQKATWGLPTACDIYFDASPVFTLSPDALAKGTVKPLVWFTNGKPLRSGWAWGQAYLQGGVTAFEAQVGKGKLYAFGPEITFRAQTHGTFKMLFNQLIGVAE
ncbi:M14 metallopeptidase family protein [Paraflavitalea sp. CAU 1676]|uniref:M14 family metallopeptidase n=1 Tax=Paraflavitalea sp. CAU 1676 TaxID=3032598 RepID=UPI0023DA7694|nr:M14 metallopeptidase family protein [Paraflavitalea sp. CAU 1676]MDF2190376.1 M14 family metallopeptidase [Paraflavitalea sp. CAU 1676]